MEGGEDTCVCIDSSWPGKNCSTVANTTIYSIDFNTDFPVLQLFPASEPTASGTYFNLRNGERERTIHRQYTSLHNRKVVVLWRGRVCLYISISSLYPLTELVISYLHTSCECFRRFLVRVYFIVRGVAMRCVTSSPVLIWLGCTLCTCKVCRLRLRRCQRSTRASVWD